MFSGKTILAAALAVGITMLTPLSSEAKHHHRFNGNNGFVNLGQNGAFCGRGQGRYGKSMYRNIRNNNYFNPYANNAFYNRGGCNNNGGWGNGRWNQHSAWQNWNGNGNGWRNNSWNNNGNHYGWRNSPWRNGNGNFCGNGGGRHGRHW